MGRARMKMTKQKLKIVFLSVYILLLITGHIFCRGCDAEDRLIYSLSFTYGAFLIWGVLFSEVVTFRGYSIDNKSGFKYLILGVGVIFATYSVYLFWR